MTSPDPDLAALTFESALQELETVVARLESGQATLDESITLYTRGEALRAHCEGRLKEAQMRIEKITLASDGTPTGTTAFAAS